MHAHNQLPSGLFYFQSHNAHFIVITKKRIRILFRIQILSTLKKKKNRFQNKIETLAILFFVKEKLHVQFRLDALLVLTFMLSHKKRCSYFRCCDREREFGSVVPFKCRLLNVPVIEMRENYLKTEFPSRNLIN